MWNYERLWKVVGCGCVGFTAAVLSLTVLFVAAKLIGY